MPTALSPDILALLQAARDQQMSSSGSMMGAPRTGYTTGPDGSTYQQAYMGGWQGGEAGIDSGPGTLQYTFRDQVPGHHAVGDMQDVYSPSGQFINSQVIPKDDSMREFLTGASIMLAPLAAGAMGAGAGAAGGAEAAGGAVAGDAFLPGALGAGYSGIPYGSVLPGLEQYVVPAAAGGAAGGAAGASMGGGSGGFGGAGAYTTAAADSQAANAAIAAAGGNPYTALGAGALGTGVYSNPVSGGLLDSLSMGGLGKYLLPLAGAALGSQGTNNSSTTARDIPEWLKPYVNSLLGHTQQTLDRQMAPGYLSGYDDMRRVGQQMINAPVAGNGYAAAYSQPPLFMTRGILGS